MSRLWDQAFAESKAQIRAEIMDTLDSSQPSVKLRISPDKATNLDADELLRLFNMDSQEEGICLAGLVKDDPMALESGRNLLNRRINEHADYHAELEADDAERRHYRDVMEAEGW